jgi:hypothetical protein
MSEVRSAGDGGCSGSWYWHIGGADTTLPASQVKPLTARAATQAFATSASGHDIDYGP